MGRATREYTDEDWAFLAAINAAPRDDAPRLVYADWLEEHGDPERAEFIRTQFELEEVPAGHLPPPWLDRRGRTRDTVRDPRRARLARRAAALLKGHVREWAEPLPGFISDRYEFRRGFVEAAEVTAERLVRLGKGLFNVAPVRHVWLTHVDDGFDQFDQLLASPALPRLEGLDLSWNYTFHHRRWRALLTSPRLRRLWVLRAEKTRGGSKLSGANLTALFASSHLRRLTELDLTNQSLNDRQVQALASWPCLARVARLDLTGGEFGVAGARALARSPHLKRLVELNLSHTSLPDAGWRELLESPNLARLTWLGIDDAWLDGETGRALRERFGEEKLDRHAGY